MTYRCVFHSSCNPDTVRHLDVPADCVEEALDLLRAQMVWENERLLKVVAITPERMFVNDTYEDHQARSEQNVGISCPNRK